MRTPAPDSRCSSRSWPSRASAGRTPRPDADPAMSGVQRSVSADADPINDDRAWRGQHGQILAGIVLIGHQRGRLVGLVEGLAEEAVPGGGRGLERGSWV